MVVWLCDKLLDGDGQNEFVGDAMGIVIGLIVGNIEGLALDDFLGAPDGVAIDGAKEWTLASAAGLTVELADGNAKRFTDLGHRSGCWLSCCWWVVNCPPLWYVWAHPVKVSTMY